ncbi:MAG: hypothetical protein FJY20_05860 [Bacteroidetes bacterium]|nr:hypothetical protein [Bacteroidota bacterium]
MKNYFIIGGLIFLTACGSNKKDEPEAAETDTVDAAFNWEASLNDRTGQMEVIKKEEAGPDSLTASAVIAFLYKKNPNVLLQFVKISGDTLYVSIPDAHYLTQQMGSTGPQLYFAEAVYNLTEIPGIRYVNFDFEEGDHASPAVLGRDDFKNR